MRRRRGRRSAATADRPLDRCLCVWTAVYPPLVRRRRGRMCTAPSIGSTCIYIHLYILYFAPLRATDQAGVRARSRTDPCRLVAAGWCSVATARQVLAGAGCRRIASRGCGRVDVSEACREVCHTSREHLVGTVQRDVFADGHAALVYSSEFVGRGPVAIPDGHTPVKLVMDCRYSVGRVPRVPSRFGAIIERDCRAAAPAAAKTKK